MRAAEWLLIEWSEGEDEPTKYFLTTAPDEAILKQMLFVTKMHSGLPVFEAGLRSGTL